MHSQCVSVSTLQYKWFREYTQNRLIGMQTWLRYYVGFDSERATAFCFLNCHSGISFHPQWSNDQKMLKQSQPIGGKKETWIFQTPNLYKNCATSWWWHFDHEVKSNGGYWCYFWYFKNHSSKSAQNSFDQSQNEGAWDSRSSKHINKFRIYNFVHEHLGMKKLLEIGLSRPKLTKTLEKLWPLYFGENRSIANSIWWYWREIATKRP